MNKSKAILGWNADLANGRDFRVEDRLDGRGQTVTWLTDTLPAPGPAELEAGWASWLARGAAAPMDPLAALTAQVEAIRQALKLPAEAAFRSYLESRETVGKQHERG